jgi:hypothetical protein
MALQILGAISIFLNDYSVAFTALLALIWLVVLGCYTTQKGRAVLRLRRQARERAGKVSSLDPVTEP